MILEMKEGTLLSRAELVHRFIVPGDDPVECGNDHPGGQAVAGRAARRGESEPLTWMPDLVLELGYRIREPGAQPLGLRFQRSCLDSELQGVLREVILGRQGANKRQPIVALRAREIEQRLGLGRDAAHAVVERRIERGEPLLREIIPAEKAVGQVMIAMVIEPFLRPAQHLLMRGEISQRLGADACFEAGGDPVLEPVPVRKLDCGNRGFRLNLRKDCAKRGLLFVGKAGKPDVTREVAVELRRDITASETELLGNITRGVAFEGGKAVCCRRLARSRSCRGP